MSFDPRTLDFAKADGLVPVVAQHFLTGEVLMLGYASADALDRTLETGRLTFHSRSRNTLWTKGETSGNTLRVVSLHADCDGDAVLARVDPAGPTCHTGARSCFAPGAPEAGDATDATSEPDARDARAGAADRPLPTLAALADTLMRRRDTPTPGSYTARLLADRNLRLKKLGEEAAELAVAAADEDVERVKEEAADVVYHALVAALAAGVTAEDILGVLEARARPDETSPPATPPPGASPTVSGSADADAR